MAGPHILSSSAWGQAATSKRIQVAQIGCGREGTVDMTNVMNHSLARVVAVCDLDSRRLGVAKGKVEHFYGAKEAAVEVKGFHDYHELLARPDIDAVVVSVPDHWHALVASAAVLAGKDVYVQKPLTYAIAESQALRKVVQARQRIVQVGSQQRSEYSFRRATELVRNGHIGKLQTVRIGLGMDKPSGKAPDPGTPPPNLDYARWLGPAPEQPYMEGRVHSQTKIDSRPGWITTEDFGLGMVTNWGAHHMDIAQWGMGMELSGPSTITAKAEFMTNDQWTVHTKYHVEMAYANGVQLILDDSFPVGIRFEGEGGWIFCTRGAVKVTASDPNAGVGASNALQASDPQILQAKIAAGGKLWPASSNHYLNWLESVAARTQPVAPVEQAARSLTACAIAWIAMKLNRKLTWDPVKEEFIADDQANAMRSRKPRSAEYDLDLVLKKAGV